MGVLWDKVWRDLWENKGRTLQVVLIIAVGTFAIGMIIGTRQFMISGMQLVWGMSSPATIYLWTSPGVDEDGLAALGRVDGVTAIDGIAQAGIEWRLSPDDPWQPAGLSARRDYDEQIVSTYELIDGETGRTLRVNLKYGPNGEHVIQHIERVSKPGCRVYCAVSDMKDVRQGTGISIVSTSKGVLSNREARKQGVGGELICQVW